MVSDSPRAKDWENFLIDQMYGYAEEIERIADNFPEERSLYVDWYNLQRHNEEMAENFLYNPREEIPFAEDAIQALTPPDRKCKINFRIKNLPSTQTISIPELRIKDLEGYISLEGIVRGRSEVRPRMSTAIYKCSKCEFNIMIPQGDSSLREPAMCPNCEKPASKTSFELLKMKSVYVDLQMIDIQELPEHIKGTAPPQSIKVFVYDDLCGRVMPGERVSISGILFASQRTHRDRKSVDFDMFLDGYHILQEESVYEEIEITDKDKEEILKLSKEGMLFEMIRDSIAPDLFEIDIVKEALALQLFGGVTKETEGSQTRGDINILMIGDPGTGKSQLLKFMSSLAPRGVFASGKGASSAGLTASVVKDEYDGRWSLEGGALVLADRGMLCLDEMDKMSDENRSSMHEAMEQQQITITKSIKATLRCRCSILAAANPKKGRFDDKSLYTEQINLPPTLLSRFDLIFPMIDLPDKERDHTLAKKIILRHKSGELLRNEGKEFEAFQVMNLDPPISKELLQKYIAYAKKNIFPVMNDTVIDHLLKYYITQRETGLSDDLKELGSNRITITIRQLEGLIRLSEASARLRLSPVIELSDCKRAQYLFNEYLRLIARDETGKLDIDLIMTGTSTRKRQIGITIVEIIDGLKKNPELDTIKGVELSMVIVEAKKLGIEKEDLLKALDKMKDQGMLFEPALGKINIIKER